MRRLLRMTLLCLCVIGLLGFAAGCKQADRKPADDTPAKTAVSLCEVTHSVFYAPQYVALCKGFFEEEGLDVTLSTGEGADKVMAAVLSGGIDIGFAGPEAAIYVYREGRDNYPRVFAQLTKRDGSFLIGRKADPAFTWSSLKGKTVLPGRVGGVPYMTLRSVLHHTGKLDPDKDLTLDSSIQYALMTGAFASGTGDYVTAFEPAASTLEQQGQGYVVASVGEAAGEIPYTAYFASKAYMEQHPDTVQAFTNAIYKGQRWVAAHTAEEIAACIAPQFADTDTALLTSAIQRYRDIDAWCSDPVLSKAAYRRLQDVMIEAGELTEYVAYAPVVDTTFAGQSVRFLSK